jgi:hypothetical protein
MRSESQILLGVLGLPSVTRVVSSVRLGGNVHSGLGAPTTPERDRGHVELSAVPWSCMSEMCAGIQYL